MIYFVSDRHFFHRNICKYADRPYDSPEAMNADLIRRHNNAVGPQDIFYDLGDFGFGPVETQAEILKQLNGKKKILIRGNHDRGLESMYEMGWDAVVEEAILKYRGSIILLRHRPFHGEIPSITHTSKTGQPTTAPMFDYVFHGHIHNSDHRDLIEAGEAVDIPPFNLNLSVEVIGYRPVSFKHAIKMVTEQVEQGRKHYGPWPRSS